MQLNSIPWKENSFRFKPASLGEDHIFHSFFSHETGDLTFRLNFHQAAVPGAGDGFTEFNWGFEYKEDDGLEKIQERSGEIYFENEILFEDYLIGLPASVLGLIPNSLKSTESPFVEIDDNDDKSWYNAIRTICTKAVEFGLNAIEFISDIGTQLAKIGMSVVNGIIGAAGAVVDVVVAAYNAYNDFIVGMIETMFGGVIDKVSEGVSNWINGIFDSMNSLFKEIEWFDDSTYNENIVDVHAEAVKIGCLAFVLSLFGIKDKADEVMRMVKWITDITHWTMLILN